MSYLPEKSATHKEQTGEHPGRDGSEQLGLRRVGSDSVEGVDENQQERDEQCHPTGDGLRGDDEGDPGDNHE